MTTTPETTTIDRFAAACGADLAAIDALREAALTSLQEATDRGLTDQDAAAFAADMAEIETRCAYIRHRWLPDAVELYVALGAAIAIDERGQARIVWTKDNEEVTAR